MNSSRPTRPTSRVENDTNSLTHGASRAKTEGQRPLGLERGTAIGRYTILEHLGAGGMATVYSAYDTQLERIVALKMLRAELETEEVHARMLREAQAMARLKHPHVVTVYEVSTFENRIYIAMEFVDGTTLSKWGEKPRAWRELLNVLKAAGRGLAAAHDADLVHRDFKPDNVLVGNDGRVLVGDFGIALSRGDMAPEEGLAISETGRRARSTNATGSSPAAQSVDEGGSRQPQSVPSNESSSPIATERLTEEGAVLGTPGYIAPEHLLGSIDDARSDQFSFCVTMYRVLYGTRPFDNRNLPTYCVAVQRPPNPPPSSTSVPRWVHAIILRGLQLDPQHRFASMHELLAALERDPSKRRARWALGACLTAAAVTSVGAYGRHQAGLLAKSREGVTIMASTWNTATEQRIRESLERTDARRGADLARTVVGKLAEYARNWTETHRSVSEATLVRGEQDSPTMDRRLRCLERGREQFAALTEVFAQGKTDAAGHAVDAVYALDRPATCQTSDATTIRLLPAEPALRARALAAEHAIAEAAALHSAGDDAQAERVVEQALPDVRAIPYAHAEAELLLIAALAKHARDDKRASLELNQRAFVAAQRAGDDSLAARAAGKSAQLFGSWLDNPQEGERWMTIAEAISDRVGPNHALQAEVLASRIVVNVMARHPEKNIELQKEHLKLVESLYGAADPRVAAAIGNRAVTYFFLHQLELALADAQRALEIQILVVGPNHSGLALPYSNLGAFLYELHRFEEARSALRQAMEVQAGMPPGAATVNIYSNLGAVELELGNTDAALENLEKGLRLVQEIGMRGGHEWGLRLLRAEVCGIQGNPEEKAKECARVLAQAEAADANPQTLPSRTHALACLGTAELSLGKLNAALSHLEQSALLQASVDPSAPTKGAFALARALRAAHRDPLRACELAERARTDAQARPGKAILLAEIDAFLANGCSASSR